MQLLRQQRLPVYSASTFDLVDAIMLSASVQELLTVFGFDY